VSRKFETRKNRGGVAELGRLSRERRTDARSVASVRHRGASRKAKQRSAPSRSAKTPNGPLGKTSQDHSRDRRASPRRTDDRRAIDRRDGSFRGDRCRAGQARDRCEKRRSNVGKSGHGGGRNIGPVNGTISIEQTRASCASTGECARAST